MFLHLLFVHLLVTGEHVPIVLPDELEEVVGHVPNVDGVVEVPPLGVVVLDEVAGVQGQVLLQPLHVVVLTHGLDVGEGSDEAVSGKVRVAVRIA